MKRIVVLLCLLSVLWPGTAQTFIRSLPTSTNLTSATKVPVDDATYGTRAVTLQNLLASTATNATLLAAITNVVEDTATSLLGNKLDATNGTAVNLTGSLTNATLLGATTYSGPSENDVSTVGEFSAALIGSLTSDPTLSPRIRSVQTVYALTNTPVSVASIYGTVDVMEFYSGSGGGGKFRLTLAAGKTVTTTGRYLPSTSATYCWERIVGATFDIREYGAVAGGSTNCRNAIQMAANAAYEAGSGTVVIPPGDYRVAPGPYIDWPAGVNMRGDGGVLWISLPDSYDRASDFAAGYSASRATPITDEWIDINSVTRSGYTNSATGNWPWNGKGVVFANVANSVWTGVVIDGGWGANATLTRPSGVIPIVGVTSISGGSASEEFTYYQLFSNIENSRFSGCSFYNCPGAIFSSPRYISVTGCYFTDYGDHVIYARAGQGSNDADLLTFTGNQIVATRKSVGTSGTYPYTSVPPSTNFVSATVRDAIKIQNSQFATVANNSMQSYDATFATIEAWPRTDNAGTNSWIDTANIRMHGNVFSGFRFAYLSTSRRSSSGTVTTITALPEGQKLRNISLSDNIVTLRTATNWNGGGGKFIHSKESPAYGQDYGAAVDGLRVSGNLVIGSDWRALAIGNPEYAVGWTNVAIIGNQFYSGTATGFLMLGGRLNHVRISGNVIEQSDPNNTGSVALLRSFDTREKWFGEITVAGNVMRNLSTVLWENLSSVTAAYDNSATYSYSTTAFDDFTLTNRSIARASGGAIYRNTTATTGGGDPSVNANWSVYEYPTFDLILSGNTKRCVSTALTATERAGYLTYFYSPASQQMPYSIRVTHSGNVNIGTYGDTAAYGLSSPPDVSTHVVDATLTADVPSPLLPMGYVDVANSRIGFGYNFTAPATTMDIEANEVLFGADNGSPNTRTANTTKTARFNSLSYAGSTATPGTRVSGFEMLNAASYSQFVIGANSGGVYLPTIFNVRLGSTITTAGNTASRDVIYADGNLRVAINGTSFTGSEKLNVNGGIQATSLTTAGNIELGHASDTTLARSAAGVVTIEGNAIITSTTIRSGTGAPEGVVTAPVGTLFLRTDGGAGSTLYVKESGAGNTGWVAK